MNLATSTTIKGVFPNLLLGFSETGAGDYRYGGKEQDSEVSGTGNLYDYGFRICNSRLSKFLSVDPLVPDYPWYTPYQIAGNTQFKQLILME